ncbi:MAG TPA: ABC transporter ATP-binding protein [Aggregatilineales bacterium]|nr:ABC transporter ATP-binding protein [Aggregatilineales bacterium]
MVEAPLLSVSNLHVTFHTPSGDVRALRGVDFSVASGEIVGLVGETGCGKSITGRAIMRLIDPPGEITEGRIQFDGQDLNKLNEPALRQLRGGQIAMIFQNPGAALNPLFTIGQQLTAVIRQHETIRGTTLRQRALQLLADVGLPDPRDIFHTYPHQLSGGMQQRAMIAIALSSNPHLLIADEPTTALDVTIQAQILDLLTALRRARGISIILITHDLSIVAETCDRVVVLYAGKVAEDASIRRLFAAPGHPYTEALLDALPQRQTRKEVLRVISGSVPSGIAAIPGCAFANRCAYVMDICSQPPPLFRLNDEQQAACFRHKGNPT